MVDSVKILIVKLYILLIIPRSWFNTSIHITQLLEEKKALRKTTVKR